MAILVAVNRSAGLELLSAAEECARALSTSVLLVRVLARPGERAEAAARAYLDTLVAHFATRGIAAEARIRSGAVAANLLREAREGWVSAIVLGTSRRPAVLSAVVGSISNTIQRAAPCPVLLVERAPVSQSEEPVLSFSQAAERSGGVLPRLARMETVDVTYIVGSVGRARELGADFRPPRSARRRHDEDRLRRVRDALEAGKVLPPLELYKLGSGYYVLDGHHRVAAALQIGQMQVDAHVIEYVPAN